MRISVFKVCVKINESEFFHTKWQNCETFWLLILFNWHSYRLEHYKIIVKLISTLCRIWANRMSSTFQNSKFYFPGIQNSLLCHCCHLLWCSTKLTCQNTQMLLRLMFRICPRLPCSHITSVYLHPFSIWHLQFFPFVS